MNTGLWLRIDDPADETTIVCVTEEGVIGRDLRCDVVVHDIEASRIHARLTPTGTSGWTIADLDTTNGTFVNDARIVGAAALQVDDCIRIGRVCCTVVQPAVGR